MRADSINHTLLGKLHQRKDALLAGTAQRLPRWVTPNGITILRIILVIPIYWLYTRGYIVSTLIVFGVALVTDVLDGVVARQRGHETTTGKLFDPAADKILIITVFFIVALDRVADAIIYTLVGLELGLVILAIVISPLVQRFTQRKPRLGANNAGKIKMTLESIAVALLLISSGQTITMIATYLLGGAAFFAALSIILHLILREPNSRSY
ncbi:MAG: CDP-alcohol phosphatidyltransferase family protein [Candidatus Kerfeldbacteria bacterium]|nr:CDP-alcohol phosphatidyltransferase family protein [Candidatus Kerfeldbacteria bacterium]